MTKNDFSVGERVRVYGVCGNFSSISIPTTITKVEGDLIHTESKDTFKSGRDGYDLTIVHRLQVRRLKPRKPMEQRERVEGWAHPNTDFVTKRLFAKREVAVACEHKSPIHLVELRDSEIICDREKLAEAWDGTKKSDGAHFSHSSEMFSELCNLLGIPPEAK